MAQLFGKAFMILAKVVQTCTESQRSYGNASSLFKLVFIAVGVFGTNLLSHRYMLEKAKVMTGLTYVSLALTVHTPSR